MKRVLFLAAALLLAHAASAQALFFETFTEGIPTTWTLLNDGNQAHNPDYKDAWCMGRPYGNPKPCALSTSWFNAPAEADRWMITAPVVVPGEEYYLMLEAAAFELTYADGFEVRLSTSGDSLRSLFGSPVLSVAHCDTAFTEYCIDLSDYAGDSLWVAVIQNSYDQNLLFVDNLRIARPDDAELELTRFILPEVEENWLPLQAVVTNKSHQTYEGPVAYTCLVNGVEVHSGQLDSISLEPAQSLAFTAVDSLLLTDTLNCITLTVVPVSTTDFEGNNSLTVALSASGEVVGIQSPTPVRRDTLRLYPNPTTGPFTVEGAQGPVRIYNMQGRQVQQPLRPGLYIVTDGHSTSKLVISQ